MGLPNDSALLNEAFSKTGRTLSVAESCTGGLVSSAIVSVPGVSSFFIGSAVTYSDSSKINVLGVRGATLELYGTVSAETAEEMASAAMRLFGSDIAGSVTGAAGPSGACGKPAGLVFVGIASEKGVRSIGFQFEGSRDDVRNGAARALIRELMTEIGK